MTQRPQELEARYRRVMRLLPRAYREAREEEMLAVLLEAAEPHQRRPSARDVADLLRTAVLLRLRQLFLVDPVAQLGMAATTVLLVVGLLLLTQVLEARGQLGTAETVSPGVALPAQLPPWWPTPASASDSPAGPAIAYYGNGDEDGQPFRMLVSASGNSVRKAPRVATDATGHQDLPRSRGRTLLSPDGRLLATMGNTDERLGTDADGSGRLTVLDLETGARRALPGREFSPQDALLAWSRDGSRLAWRRDGRLQVLDRRTGRVEELGAGPSTAAFAPGDDRLAVVRGDALEVLDAAGRLLSTQHLAWSLEIARAGWSPDGRRVALVRPFPGESLGWELAPGHAGAGPSAFVVTDANGDQAQARTYFEGAEPLAWHGEDEVLLWAGREVERYDLSTGGRSPMVSLQEPGFEGSGEIWDLQLATALAAEAEVVPRGTPDRGPLSTRWYATVAILILVGAGVALWRRPSRPPAWRRHRWPRLVGVALAYGAVAVVVGVPLAVLYVLLALGLGPDQLFVHGGVLCLVAAAHVAARSVLRAGETACPAPSTLP